MSRRVRGSGLYRNIVSYVGFLISFFGAFLTLFSMVLRWSLKQPSPYMGIFTFMIFPSIVAFGLFLVIIGMWREGRRRLRVGTEEALPFPRLDLNDTRHRRIFAVATVGSLFFMTLFAFTNYNAFLFTESNTFCGQLCHTVMEPEFTAYKHSPHSRVSCVECHVGHGATFYVQSKLSGLRQLFAVTFNTYPMPISTPVKSLRPARETCEECHWPQKFYGAMLVQIPYFRYDEKNTSDQISLLVKTGGGSARLGRSAGIHWHMITQNKIIFATPDPKQQEIPWFMVVELNGTEKKREYMSIDKPISKQKIAALPKHVMDCMDCHNRPTHIFMPPDRAMDYAMANGNIAQDLPWIKKTTTEAIMSSYKGHSTAKEQIRKKILGFYEKNYPVLAKKRFQDIDEAVSMVTDVYDRTVFPKMKVDWDTYPDNIGHRNWPGCFRCHDGKHVTKDGKVLTKKCTTCHTMPQRGPLENLGATPPVSDQSWHPFALKGKHAQLLCNRCHSPGIRPSSDCATCHKHDPNAPMASLDCSNCHIKLPSKHPIGDCASCHAALSGAHKLGGHPAMDCQDCHKPHTWKVTKRETCLTCHKDKKKHNAPSFCGECHDFTAGK